ncbi:unnamed protein product [Heterobilharzia americana]|nr:unnamed protein product [Heterobilharzia americana]CAH8442841.1 unnamed protein product [Heterobilharzia americana]
MAPKATPKKQEKKVSEQPKKAKSVKDASKKIQKPSKSLKALRSVKGGKVVKPGNKNVQKALKAQRAITLGTHTKGKKRVMYTTRFRRPKTYKPPRCPKDRRFLIPKRNKLDAFRIIQHPVTTEAAMKKIEDNDTLVFIVDRRANKPAIKAAVQELYNIKVAKSSMQTAEDQAEKNAFINLKGGPNEHLLWDPEPIHPVIPVIKSQPWELSTLLLDSCFYAVLAIILLGQILILYRAFYKLCGYLMRKFVLAETSSHSMELEDWNKIHIAKYTPNTVEYVKQPPEKYNFLAEDYKELLRILNFIDEQSRV